MRLSINLGWNLAWHDGRAKRQKVLDAIEEGLKGLLPEAAAPVVWLSADERWLCVRVSDTPASPFIAPGLVHGFVMGVLAAEGVETI